jgi:hypothetical protein
LGEWVPFEALHQRDDEVLSLALSETGLSSLADGESLTLSDGVESTYMPYALPAGQALRGTVAQYGPSRALVMKSTTKILVKAKGVSLLDGLVADSGGCITALIALRRSFWRKVSRELYIATVHFDEKLGLIRAG